MTIHPALRAAWKSFFVLTKRRSEPLWARMLVGAMLAMAVSLLLILVSAALMAKADLNWWRGALRNNFVNGIGAAAVMLAMLRLLELILPAALLDRLSSARDWRTVALMSVLLIVGTALGVRASFFVLREIYQFDMWPKVTGQPIVLLKFLIFTLLIVAANWVWWLLRMKEKALAHQATESQLRMLQAQMEPHFLFNTLANVQSLIASDAPRAQLMLETFTDYLRASLGQMRDTDSTLEAELETARNYLQLMQIRMGDRLSFSIDASAEARSAILPPLLLQPLVENAVHHGLEQKIEGGSVRVSARVHDGRLEVVVADDGLGLEGGPRRARPGNGVALVNLRTRLATRYGNLGTMSLERKDGETLASLTLPYSGKV